MAAYRHGRLQSGNGVVDWAIEFAVPGTAESYESGREVGDCVDVLEIVSDVEKG
jgi:hypothetical protein